MDITSTVVGGVIGIVGGIAVSYFTQWKNNKNEIKKQKRKLLNQLSYSYELFEEYTDNMRFHVVTKGTWIVEENCKECLKYIDFTTEEKKDVLEWLMFLEDINNHYYDFKRKRCVFTSEIKRDGVYSLAISLLPKIKCIIDKLK